MAKPFDITLKHLLENHPVDWLAFLGLAGVKDVEVIDADLATVTAQADKVIRINDPSRSIVNPEAQASYDAGLPQRALRYNVLLENRHGLPVQTIVILLRPEADGPQMSGIVQNRLPDGRCYLEFHYQVVRVWQQPVESVLAGGIGTLPLAPISNVAAESLPGVIRRMDERFSREAAPADAGSLWTATYLLMGLRYPRELAAVLLQGVRAMRESATYQAIVEEGEAKGMVTEAKKILLLHGRKRFGPPSDQITAAIEIIDDLAQLERLNERVQDVSRWEELFAGG